MKNKLKSACDRYIRGCYHCDSCPMCWSDWSSYLGDGDAGCYIYGDLRDTCRLIPPIRFLIGWPKKKKAQYAEDHSYDGIGEWYEQQQHQENTMREAILIALNGSEVCWRDHKGKLMPICKLDAMELGLNSAMRHYEDTCHPVIHTSLKEDWKKVLKRTWNAFLEPFRPYFRKY